ncbi:MAG: hypothetical protein U1E39_03830 [Planctomycetota bacterium]
MRRILRPIPSLVFAAALLGGRPGLASDAPSAPPKAVDDVPQGLPAVTDAAFEEALVAAGKNRPALEGALAHFTTRGEPAKAAAVRFLVANMPGKGYIVTAWKAKDGTTVTYDPLAYPTFKEAVAAFDALEAAHGAIDAVRDHIVLDVETMTTAYLVRHVENAFAAWRNAPPGQRVAGPAFAEHVLPYRGSEEPLEDWLTPLLARYAAAPDAVVKASTPRACLDWVGGDAGRRVRFDERYYLHPTDQGFAEMERSGMGRCEDITNMTTYAARARGLAVAADYTPAWGHRDNNHAWPVLLDASGRGSEPGNAHAAKVYRKVFSLQRDGLPYRLPAGREPPNRFLASKSQVDVTDQYAPTTDVEVALDAAAVAGEVHAYLCVFNGGEWVAIAWAPIVDGKATFARMGRGADGMLYLPAVHDGKDLRPAAAPRVVGKDGAITVLAGTGPATTLTATATTPEQVSVDTKEVTPVSHLAAGKTYVLSRFASGWTEVKTFVAGDAPATVEGLPADGLYWLVEQGSKRLERPFVLDGGRQRFR